MYEKGVFWGNNCTMCIVILPGNRESMLKTTNCSLVSTLFFLLLEREAPTFQRNLQPHRGRLYSSGVQYDYMKIFICQLDKGRNYLFKFRVTSLKINHLSLPLHSCNKGMEVNQRPSQRCLTQLLNSSLGHIFFVWLPEYHNILMFLLLT